MAVLETAVRSIGPDSEDTDSEKPALLADEAYTPDFFDHWMEDYASKVAEDQAANAVSLPQPP
jgi:hypothetical protein